MRILLIDNYDSFTWNLVQLFAICGAEVRVVRNDAVTAGEVLRSGTEAVCISPGPGTPAASGVSIEVVRRCSGQIPVFGVCLGMQVINEAFGGSTTRAPRPVHGMTSAVVHQQEGILHDVPSPFLAARYHSLQCSDIPGMLRITARSDDGVAMALEHHSFPLHGVQFHPESFLSEYGERIIGNFLALARRWRCQT